MNLTEIDVLRDVSQRLNSAGIDFMLTGSVAMTHYARPRMTRDIDFVVDLAPIRAETVVKLFEPEYYVSPEAVRRAISRRSIFNLIHLAAMIKVDFVVLKDEPFRREEFARRREIPIADFHTWIVSREDLILSKLVWAKPSHSEMQLRDVRNLLTPDCDPVYVRRQAVRLQVEELLEEVLRGHE